MYEKSGAKSVSQSGLRGIFVDVKFDTRFTSCWMWDGSPEFLLLHLGVILLSCWYFHFSWCLRMKWQIITTGNH